MSKQELKLTDSIGTHLSQLVPTGPDWSDGMSPPALEYNYSEPYKVVVQHVSGSFAKSYQEVSRVVVDSRINVDIGDDVSRVEDGVHIGFVSEASRGSNVVMVEATKEILPGTQLNVGGDTKYILAAVFGGTFPTVTASNLVKLSIGPKFLTKMQHKELAAYYEIYKGSPLQTLAAYMQSSMMFANGLENHPSLDGESTNLIPAEQHVRTFGGFSQGDAVNILNEYFPDAYERSQARFPTISVSGVLINPAYAALHAPFYRMHPGARGTCHLHGEGTVTGSGLRRWYPVSQEEIPIVSAAFTPYFGNDVDSGDLDLEPVTYKAFRDWITNPRYSGIIHQWVWASHGSMGVSSNDAYSAFLHASYVEKSLFSINKRIGVPDSHLFNTEQSIPVHLHRFENGIAGYSATSGTVLMAPDNPANPKAPISVWEPHGHPMFMNSNELVAYYSGNLDGYDTSIWGIADSHSVSVWHAMSDEEQRDPFRFSDVLSCPYIRNGGSGRSSSVELVPTLFSTNVEDLLSRLKSFADLSFPGGES